MLIIQGAWFDVYVNYLEFYDKNGDVGYIREDLVE